jgi:hypothetical protein
MSRSDVLLEKGLPTTVLYQPDDRNIWVYDENNRILIIEITNTFVTSLSIRDKKTNAIQD